MTTDRTAQVPHSGGGWPGLTLALGAGVALRVAAAGRFRSVAEWEADGFLWAWADPGTRTLASGCRAPGMQALWELWGALGPMQSVPLMRAIALLGSVLLLACAWVLCLTVLRSRGAGPPWIERARLRLCLLWALVPALVWSAPRLVPEAVSGGALCLLAAAVVRHRMAASVWTWVWLCLTCALSLALGGVVVALAVTVGLIAFLLRLPKASTALPVLGAWILAVAAAVGFARWHDDSRPWRPDTGPSYALSALVGAPVMFDDRESALPEVRGDAVWRACGESLRDRPLTVTLAEMARRAAALIAPWRFADGAGGAQTVLGIVDALLTGGAFVLAVLTLARRAPSGSAGLPRFASAAAALTLIAAAIAGATGPFSLSGVLLLAIALAAVGEPVEGPSGSRAQLARFLAGGLALTALALVPARDARPASLWLEQLTHQNRQGGQLVALLAAGGPVNGLEELQLAQILIDPATPFLRRPELAREHALAALMHLPADDEAVAVLVRAEADCLRFSAAEDLAETLLDDEGVLSPRGRLLADWVRDKAHRARLDGLR